MASAEQTLTAPGPMVPPANLKRVSARRDSIGSWPLLDRVAWALCWAVGLGLCAIAAAIVVFMFVKGIAYLSPSLLLEHPAASQSQATSGGFLDPIEGTLLLTAVGIAIAAPLGVAVAVWLCEYARPAWLARLVESSVEMIAGAPSVLLAMFGLVVFARPVLGFLSYTSAGGAVTGKSFLTAGAMMSLIGLPLVVAATREALLQVPAHVREASHALGKTRATTIRRVLLPSIRPSMTSGVTLAIGRIVGDTAIVVILLGAGIRLEGAGGLPGLSILRGSGGTLTSYVRYNSPAGEGNAHEKAYAAAFVLMLMVLVLNVIVTRLSARRTGARASVWRAVQWSFPWS
ncbi:MAG: ABC transporter permease subunit [Solirubrobacteraceae bacterium]